MSQCLASSTEAAPAHGSRRYEASVRRCKTVGHAASTHTLPDHQRVASGSSPSPSHRQLLLPIQLIQTTSTSATALNESRETAISPSRRGGTLRAYSRHRRLFSADESSTPTSPKLPSCTYQTSDSASPSTHRSHPGRGYVGTSESFNPSSLLWSRYNKGDDAADLVAYHSTVIPGDEAPSSMSSTPSLVSPASTLSRSTSLHSAAPEHNYLHDGTRYISLNGSTEHHNVVQDALPGRAAEKWTQRARSWSTTVTRRMSITAWNQTIHSTTSPYLKAGLEELRSIFDVDSLGAAIDDEESMDLEGAPTLGLHTGHLGPLFGAAGPAGSRDQMVSESPEQLSPILSRQSSCETREATTANAASRLGTSFQSQRYEPLETHHRTQSRRKHRSLSASHLLGHSLFDSIPHGEPGCKGETGSAGPTMSVLTRNLSMRSQSPRTPLVAVGLAALSIVIVGVCALETSMHPDAASLPLTTFMLTQSGFALVGVLGLALQKHWMSDLASRLIRAHVLCQVLIALAALRSLSRTAFYREPLDSHSFHGTAAAGVLTSPRFLTAHERVSNPHVSTIGSLRDQLTYMCVFAVQAALPLACAFWAQYALASALSRATRSFSKSRSASQRQDEQRQSAVTSVKATEEDTPAAPRSQRQRFNSENPHIRGNADQRSEGWLGFFITRLDVDKTVPAPSQYAIDAAELTSRLEALARAVTPTPRDP